jgi:rRNA-processing protein EBP2
MSRIQVLHRVLLRGARVLIRFFTVHIERGGGLEGGDDDDAFDVAVEDAISDKPRMSVPSSKRGKGNDGKPKSKMPRGARDAKFGFGGKGKRREKQNTRESTNDFAGGSGRSKVQGQHKAGKAGKPKRLVVSGIIVCSL